MRVWRRIDSIPYVKDRVLVTDLDENLKARYYIYRSDGTETDIAEHDFSSAWWSLDSFLTWCDEFEEVTNDGLQRIFEVEGSNSQTKRV